MKRWLSIGALCAVCTAASSAAAQQPAGPTAREKATALERFQHGVVLFDKAEVKHDPALYESALIDFQQAYILWPTDKILWNRALCAFELKRYLEALKDFKTYDQHLNVTANPSLPHHAELKKYFAEANAATVHVTIEADAGERILVDGKQTGTAPLSEPIDLLPGRHAFAAGNQASEAVLTAGATLTVNLKASAAAPAEVVPVPVSQVPPSSITPTEQPPQENSRGSWTTRHVVGTATVAVGVIVVATGVVFGQKANSAQDDANSQASKLGASGCAGANASSAACQSLHSAGNDQSSFHHTSEALLVTGLVVTAVGAGIFFLWPEKKEQSVSLAPFVSPRSGGFSLQGAF